MTRVTENKAMKNIGFDLLKKIVTFFRIYLVMCKIRLVIND